jgi:hypothetical protein
MAIKKHGTLSGLQLQPGSTFTRTQEGFDTASRTYTCDAGSISSAPAIHSPDSEYSSMFVSDVDISIDELELATVRVSYRGLISGGGKQAKLNLEFSVEALPSSIAALDIADLKPKNPKGFARRVDVEASEPQLITLGTIDSTLPQVGEIKTGIIETSTATIYWTLRNVWVLMGRDWVQIGSYYEVTNKWETQYVSEIVVVPKPE